MAAVVANRTTADNREVLGPSQDQRREKAPDDQTEQNTK